MQYTFENKGNWINQMAEGLHKDKRPGDIVKGKAKDGKPLYGKDVSVKEPKQHSMDDVTTSKSNDLMLGKHKADTEYNDNDELVAVDSKEKELSTNIATYKQNVKKYEDTINSISSRINELKASLERPYVDHAKAKEDIDNLSSALSELKAKRADAMKSLAKSQKLYSTFYS